MAANEFTSRPVRFYAEYKTLTDGSILERHWVELTRPGQLNMATTNVLITPKVMAAPDWDAIEPAYEAWKKGNAAPVHGTPLGAWPGLTPEQVQIFKAVGLQSVEDIAGMTEKVMQMVRLPEVRRYKDEAKTFLEAKDQHAVELKLKQQSEEIAALRAMLEEQAGAEPAPKRRGRPPKAEAEETQEDEAA